MNTAKLLATLDEELGRLRQVRALLAGEEPAAPVKRKRGRPAKNAPVYIAPPQTTKKRQLSEEARQRIAEAQKRRWAAQKRDAQ